MQEQQTVVFDGAELIFLAESGTLCSNQWHGFLIVAGMQEKNYTGLIPDHNTGVVIESAASADCKDADEARSLFSIAKDRLLQVNNWHQLAGVISASFQLIDSDGKEVSRNAQKGDYFKIDIPGPGSKAGGGFDWVKVEDLNEVSKPDVDSVGLRVRPASNPLSSNDSIAHFYSEESTSTFIVTRENNTIKASVYDVNTKPNTNSESLTDKMRHVAVGLGALSAFSKMQWKALAEGLVNPNP